MSTSPVRLTSSHLVSENRGLRPAAMPNGAGGLLRQAASGCPGSRGSANRDLPALPADVTVQPASADVIRVQARSPTTMSPRAVTIPPSPLEGSVQPSSHRATRLVQAASTPMAHGVVSATPCCPLVAIMKAARVRPSRGPVGLYQEHHHEDQRSPRGAQG